jgi:hypothetical protein
MKTASQFKGRDDCPLVLIDWEDSTQPQGLWQWLSEVAMPKVVRCVSAGFLIRSTDQVKTLAPNLGNVDCGEDVQASGLINIPARSILSIKLISEASASLGGPFAAAESRDYPGAATQQTRPVRVSPRGSARRGA